MSHRLAQPQGRVYNRRCDAEFADGRCRVNLAAWTGTGTIIAVDDAGRVSVSGLAGFADGFFRLGVLTLGDGRRIDIERHERRPDGSTEIGRAHVCTPVTNAHLVCRLLLEKKETETDDKT